MQWQFTIDSGAPLFSNLSPANGTITRDNKPQLAATISDSGSGTGVNSTTVVLSVDGAAVTSAFDPATGILTASSPILTDGLHTIIGTASDNAGNLGRAPEWKITVDTVAPMISAQTPQNGALLKSAPAEISMLVTDAGSGVRVNSIGMTLDGSTATFAFDPASGRVAANYANLAGGVHTVAVIAGDNAGNSTVAVQWQFTIDSGAPLFSNLSPADGAISGNRQPAISAKLTDDYSGINPATIFLSIDGTALCPSFDPAAGIFISACPQLADGWRNISLSVSDNAGNLSSAAWRIGIDITPPQLTGMSPASGGSANTPQPQISAQLSDSFSGINPDSLTFSIDGAALPYTFDPATGAVSATPATPLASGTHQVLLSVSDKSGNSATTLGWKFTVTDAVPYTPLIFSNSGERCSSLMLVGERHSIEGDMHGNGGICIEGCKQTVTGMVTAAGNVKVSGRDNNIHDIRENVPLKTMPVFDMEYYRRNADYHHPSGWNAGGSCRPLQPGIHFVNGDCRVGTFRSEAKITIVASGNIRVSSSCNNFSYADNANKMLFFSGKSIYVEGSRNSLKGLLYAPSGKCAVSGSCLQISGRIIANQVIISGCGTGVRNLECPTDATPPEIQIIYPATGAATDDANPQIKAFLHDGDSGIDTASILLKLDGMPLDFQFQASTGCLNAVPQFQLSEGVHSIALSVSDNAGNQTSAPAWNFTILHENWVLFHKSSCGQLKISGSGKIFSGRVHSNASIKISGTNNDISGRTSAVGRIDIGGTGHELPDRHAGAPAQTMPAFDFDSYVAKAAFRHNGDWNISKNDPLPAGIHYVNGNVKISGSNVRGGVTIIATGHIKVSGSGANFSNADPVNRILLFSKCGDIEISGNNACLMGIIYAPKGECRISSSGESIQGAVIADRIDISGSNKNFSLLE